MSYSILLAVALSIDTFVLAISIGLCTKTEEKSHFFKYMIIFGTTQAFMFSIGRFLFNFITSNAQQILEAIHISSIIFILLAVKMFVEYLKEEEIVCYDLTHIWRIAFLTSIDALIVGVTPLKMINSNLICVIIIFILSGIAALGGIEFARHLKRMELIEKNAKLVGAILLLLMCIVSF